MSQLFVQHPQAGSEFPFHFTPSPVVTHLLPVLHLLSSTTGLFNSQCNACLLIQPASSFFVFLVLQCDTNDIFLSWEVFVPSTCISGSLLHHSSGGQKGSTREQETQDDSSVFQCLAISLVTLKLPNMQTPYIMNTVSSA